MIAGRLPKSPKYFQSPEEDNKTWIAEDAEKGPIHHVDESQHTSGDHMKCQLLGSILLPRSSALSK